MEPASPTYQDLKERVESPKRAAEIVRRAMAKQRRTRLLGLDLGLQTTGWALLSGDPEQGEPRVKSYDATQYAGKRYEQREPNPGAYRLAWWMGEIERLVRLLKPTHAAIEDYILGTRNPRTSTSIAEMGGVVRLVLWGNQIPYRTWGPSAWKKELWGPGSGNIKKEEVERRMAEQKGIVHQTMDAVEAAAVAWAEWKARGEGR